jgi:hypothetical protein
MVQKSLHGLGLAVLVLGVALVLCPAPGYASGGGGGSVDTIRVTKCEYAVPAGAGYAELLISASSSNANAVLLAYLPTGQLLGPVQNGGRYGGTVFVVGYVPATITVISSYGGSTTVPCFPYQP